jgi:hypothetical protein
MDAELPRMPPPLLLLRLLAFPRSLSSSSHSSLSTLSSFLVPLSTFSSPDKPSPPLIPSSHTPPQVSVMVASTSSAASSATSMHEPLVYLNGCLKNISNDAANQRALVKLGALQVSHESSAS